MSSTTRSTERPPPEPRAVTVNLIAVPAGVPVRRPAGFPEGNLQGSVRPEERLGSRAWWPAPRSCGRGSQVTAGRPGAGRPAEVRGALRRLHSGRVAGLGTGGGAGQALEVASEQSGTNGTGPGGAAVGTHADHDHPRTYRDLYTILLGPTGCPHRQAAGRWSRPGSGWPSGARPSAPERHGRCTPSSRRQPPGASTPRRRRR